MSEKAQVWLDGEGYYEKRINSRTIKTKLEVGRMLSTKAAKPDEKGNAQYSNGKGKAKI